MSKKICMINNNSSEALFRKPTGGIKRFWELYYYLCSAGYEVDVFCGCTDEELKEHKLTGRCLDISQSRIGGVLSVPSLSIYRNNKNIYKEIKVNNYDCVISFDVPTTITVCLARVSKVNFFIRQDLIEYRKIQYSTQKMSRSAIYLRLLIGWVMEAICISRSERIISQCKIDLDNIRKRHPLLRRKINQNSRIQINNINPSWAKKNEKSEEPSQMYDIGFIGNFDDDRKGQGLLLEALDILTCQDKTYTAVFIGNGKKLEEYKERYKNLTGVNFVGYIDNPNEYLRSMRLMVVPSLCDSCPNTIMEALYNEVPVIGANSGGIPEILTNKDWLFNLDANSLADKIMYLFKNNKIKDLKIEQARRAKELTFNWGKAIEALLTGLNKK